MENNIETWKDVIGYESYYQVSNLGRLKRKPRKIINRGNNQTLKEKIIAPYKGRKGYLFYRLRNDNKDTKRFSAHRLVALNFTPNPLEKPEVNHMDGNKENNYLDNLEWVTTKENINHAWENGLQKDRKGGANSFAKLSEENVKEIIAMLSRGCSGVEIARLFNVTPSSISLIKKGKSWTHITQQGDTSVNINTK